MTKIPLEKIRLGVSGDAGSFSEEAGRLYAGREGIDAEIIFAIDMEGVLARLDRAEIDLGIFPVVNSQGGLVTQAFEAMGRHEFKLVSELWLEVQQCLMVLPGLRRTEIKNIATHPQAIAQCQRFIKREFPEAKIIEWADTAKAARDLQAGLLPAATAVIAPARAATLYGLELLESNIQDMRPNLTTFIIVKR
ncbi:MAG: chorismate mutase [Candidatus Magasanikbacteria bacterium RIFOXYD2_FULL_41_14]|uniref:prephenate dehydratase n=1 Tax=Candidatus Magasanikbacteria bacterium RIFOXYD2_FULL_41_14 TaxID=1798709 RepID=A0A1F6PCL1_9BACT|nr:MAG: chorismate mutase [Candidatus Magasanikbacteria bacterium RIFOXYD2_FULL_41_14]